MTKKAREQTRTRQARHRARQRVRQVIEPEDVDQFVNWAEKTLIVPHGILQGEYITIAPFQRDFVIDLFDPETQEAGLCIARKNAKSGLIAAILLSFLDGPFVQSNWRAGAVSLNAKLSGELSQMTLDFAEASALSNITEKRSPYPGAIHGKQNARVDFLSADRGSGHASGFNLAIVDELGLMTARDRDLVNAMQSSISGREGKFCAMSINGHGIFTGEMQARAQAIETSRYHLFEAPADCELDDEDFWHAANPGLSCQIKSLAYMKARAAAAMISTEDEENFRNYDLNQLAQGSASMFVSLSDFNACVGIDDEVIDPSEPVVIGFDLGETDSLSAACAIGLKTARVRFFFACGDDPEPKSRGKRDNVGSLYRRMQERGELALHPGRLVDTDLFVAQVLKHYKRIVGIASDSFSQDDLKAAAQATHYRGKIELRHSATDTTADTRDSQKLLIAAQVSFAETLGFRSAVTLSRVKQAGHALKVEKRRSNGRIDAVSAFCAAGGLYTRETRRRRRHNTGGGIIHAVRL